MVEGDGAFVCDTSADMIAEVERELNLRARVYPRWIESGRLKQSTADEQVRRLEAVLAALRTKLAEEG